MSDWADEDLKAYLVSQVGFSSGDVDSMQIEDMRALALSLLDDVPPPVTSTTQPTTNSNVTQSSYDDAPSDSQMQISQSDGNTNDMTLQTFCEMTGMEVSEAQILLEACDWSIETAISMHMDHGDTHSAPQPRREPPLDTAMYSQTAHRDFATTSHLDAITARIGGNPPIGFEDFFREMHSRDPNAAMRFGALRHNHFDDDDMDVGHQQSSHPQYDENGVRRPDPVRVSRLLGDGMVNNDFSRADEPTVEWLFDPPRHLSFPGTFQECRTLAKQEKKWILVNIQSHEEFASHQLNRDTWTDETVQEILRENFVFWQRGHTSLDAKNYSTLYHINENDLPHIGIIDPRTGSKTSTIKGYMEPRILTQTLFEYFDEHSLDSTKAGKQRTTIVNSSMGSSDKAVVIDDDDDDFDYKAEYKVTEDVRDSRVHPQDKADERETKKPRDESASDAKSSKLTAPKMDYGPVEDEPGAGEDTIRVSIKLANGKGLVRRYRKTDPVRLLFAVARDGVPEAKEGDKLFDISTTYPKASLAGRMHETLQQAELAGSQVVMQWI